MFDITILPLFLRSGREQSELPGLYVVGAPRKAARLRSQDQLMLFMSLSNSAPLKEPVYSPAQQQEMLTRLAETFFTTSGSVTAGMRAVVTRLNEFLLNRNLRAPSEGQVTGALNLAVLHGSTLLLAQAGSTQSVLLGKTQVQQFDDRQGVRGLGLSKQLVPRFYQAALEPGDVLLVCTAPPESWTPKALHGSAQLGLEHLRRRLLGQVGEEIYAAALKVQTGKGQIIRYRVGGERSSDMDIPEVHPKPAGIPFVKKDTQDKPKTSAVDKEQIAPADASASDAPWQEPAVIMGLMEDKADPAQPTVPEEDFPAPEDAADQPPAFDLPDQAWVEDTLAEQGVEDHGQADDLPAADNQPVKPFSQTISPVVQGRVQAPGQPAGGVYLGGAGEVHPSRPSATSGEPAPKRTAASQTAARPKPQAKPRTRRPGADAAFTQRIGLGLKALFQRGAAARSKVSRTVAPIASRVLPQRSEPLINLSPASMLFVAICIPLVVVAIATTVYFNAGRTEQFAAYLSNASQYVERASQQTDPNLQRDSWTQALLWLDRADLYEVNETSTSLRLQAQNGLDGMEAIIRLPYQRAVTEGFGAGVSITRMAATLNDVYLLDSSQGRVLRLYRVGSGYMVDSTFLCGPGQAGGQIIGPLVDLAVLPPNNTYRATILASDVSGNVVYCAPNQSGFDSLLLPAPETNWGNIEAINISDGYIYVLDPLVNAVWYSFGNNGVFTQEPRLFFSNQVPQMDDVVDMAIDNGFLYLLHADGRMTTCEASGFELSPTRCNDPAPYGDARINRESAPLNFPDARFVQMQTTQPPDPSLFILDDAHAAIYHFSLRRLNLQRQYRAMYDPDFPLPSESPTAFVITPNRRALLAFGNQVFYAPLP